MDPTSVVQLKDHHGSQRKSLLAILKPALSSPPQKTPQTTTNSRSFVVKFNSDLQKISESEYRSKNSHLFTWNQTFQHQSKLKFLPSSKHLMSQTHIVGKDETTEIIGTNELSLNNSTRNAHLNSIQEIDNNFEPVQTLKPRKRVPKEKFQANSFTQGCFNELKKSALDEKKKTNLSFSQREKKSFSVVKLQMDLLKNPSSPLIRKITNLQFMSNQFDRRNFNVNKILNRITAQTDMLDPQDVQDETIKKLKYVVKDVKLTRILKPRTTSNSISRPITFNPQKKPENNIIETFSSPVTRVSIQKSPPKTALDLNNTRNQRSKVIILGRGSPELETITSQKREDSSIMFCQEEGPYSFINKSELKRVLRKVKKRKEKEDTNPKQYVQNVESGLKQLDTINHNLKNEQHFRNTTNSNFFVKVQSKIKHPGAIISPHNMAREDIKENLVITRSKSLEASGENMFQYGKYFKDKYMEKGLYFEVSQDLKQRIKEFGQDLKESAKKISMIDLKNT